jgi:hypothetical protein
VLSLAAFILIGAGLVLAARNPDTETRP